MKAPPTSFPDRYEWIGNTLEGGQGKIYICTDNNLDRLVAIKVMKDVGDSAAIKEAIKNEITSIREIQSKHVAEIYDLIDDPELRSIALVEEFIPGEDLTNYAATNPGLQEYLRTVFQIASGIADIHAYNRIHRDIKPNNMKFDAEGVVKIFDFGFSCEQDPDAETIAARGTKGFRAPELYEGLPAQVTADVDTYAFGVTAWALASGDIPPVLWEIPPQKTAPAPSFEELPLNLPPDITEKLNQTLKVDPEERPSMPEVRDVIARRLLYGKHRAVMATPLKLHEISSPGEATKIKVANLGSITIKYDGLIFVIEDLEGDVYINNAPVMVRQTLPGSCVITIGGPELGPVRSFIPFGISHPEVVL